MALLWLASACSSPPKAPLDLLRPIRISVRASGSTREISTLSYKGGFEPKTLLYETLVKRDERGRIAPALAQSWRFEADGKECVLELRKNARFHDGSPVTAEAVRQHFQRWVGLPEHDWLSCNQHIVAVRAEGPQTLRIVMDEPRALLPDLCAINPCAVRAPSTLDFEGNFVKPIGSGPFVFESVEEDGSVLH
jgi:ABC-type transport system substrate-binding protein